MKKGEKKIIKDKKKDEIVVVEKIVHPKASSIDSDPLIIEISTALFALEERQSEIIELLNKVSDRMGMHKI